MERQFSLGPEGFTLMTEFVKKMITNGILGSTVTSRFQADAFAKKTGNMFLFLAFTEILSDVALDEL